MNGTFGGTLSEIDEKLDDYFRERITWLGHENTQEIFKKIYSISTNDPVTQILLLRVMKKITYYNIFPIKHDTKLWNPF